VSASAYFHSGSVPAGVALAQSLLVQVLHKASLADGKPLAGVPTEPRDSLEGRIRYQAKTLAVNPADKWDLALGVSGSFAFGNQHDSVLDQ
jgi:hypothetical protein